EPAALRLAGPPPRQGSAGAGQRDRPTRSGRHRPRPRPHRGRAVRGGPLRADARPGRRHLGGGLPVGPQHDAPRGNVSQLDVGTWEEGKPSRLMVDASVSYGASGGGVFQASTGRLVGLVEGYQTARVSFKGEAADRYIDVPVPGETYVTSLGSI